MVWLVSWMACALAGTPGWVRAGRPLDGTVALVAVQVEGFAGGWFEDPGGSAVPTPPWPAAVDLDAVAEAVRREVHEVGEQVGLTVVDAPAEVPGHGGPRIGTPQGFPAISWSDDVPQPLQRLLAPAWEADMVLVMRVTVGWCMDGNTATLCVRARETTLGHGSSAVLGYGFRHRTHVAGRRVRSARPTLVARRYRYRRTATAAGDQPIPGRGNTLQAQAEHAARTAAQGFVRAARGRRGR